MEIFDKKKWQEQRKLFDQISEEGGHCSGLCTFCHTKRDRGNFSLLVITFWPAPHYPHPPWGWSLTRVIVSHNNIKDCAPVVPFSLGHRAVNHSAPATSHLMITTTLMMIFEHYFSDSDDEGSNDGDDDDKTCCSIGASLNVSIWKGLLSFLGT